MTRELFGKTTGGSAVTRVELRGGGLTARLLDWGATLQDLRLEGHSHSLVLGFPDFGSYEDHSPYFGATAGRCANRIAWGRFRLDGNDYQLERNEAGLHHLHGGSQGTAHRIWTIADLASDRVRFEIADPDGHMGYPGTCRIACTYRLTDDGGLSVVHEAETDRVTLCNLTHHSYFNLDGGPDIFDHALMIAADQYLPTDAERIPLGEIAPVAETPFDFRQMRSLGQAIRNGHADYDHNFCVSYRRVEKRQVAELRSDESGISMQVLTSEPGLQFYCGSMLDTPVNGHDGRPYGRYAGLCLESQVWPDAANHEDFPSAVLQPGEGLRQETDYVFSKR